MILQNRSTTATTEKQNETIRETTPSNLKDKDKNKSPKNGMKVASSICIAATIVFAVIVLFNSIGSYSLTAVTAYINQSSSDSTKVELLPYINESVDITDAVNNALECLRLTKPDLPNLQYPKDAFEHYEEIHHRLYDWTQHSDHKSHKYANYSGPWIENYWITHFQSFIKASKNSLQSVFGPYIPIFIPWVDIWIKQKRKYPDGLVKELNEVLREDVLYITVSQNDQGFTGKIKSFKDIQKRYALTVLSSGGYGHVPLPLLKQPEAIIKPKIPMNERKHLISYVGRNDTAPGDMRQKMINQGYFYYYGEDWKEVMKQSKFQLCPRGFGRTSFHVMEALQMGLIPVQIHMDLPWLPYSNGILKNLSFVATVDELPALVEQLSKMTDAKIEAMEKQIEGLRDEYFTFDGVMKQISKFMLNEADNELVCQKLPSKERCPICP